MMEVMEGGAAMRFAEYMYRNYRIIQARQARQANSDQFPDKRALAIFPA